MRVLHGMLEVEGMGRGDVDHLDVGIAQKILETIMHVDYCMPLSELTRLIAECRPQCSQPGVRNRLQARAEQRGDVA